MICVGVEGRVGTRRVIIVGSSRENSSNKLNTFVTKYYDIFGALLCESVIATSGIIFNFIISPRNF